MWVVVIMWGLLLLSYAMPLVIIGYLAIVVFKVMTLTHFLLFLILGAVVWALFRLYDPDLPRLPPHDYP